MGTRPLLRNARHRIIITPVNPLCLRLIHISPSYRTVYRSFDIILEWNCPLDCNWNPMFYANPLLQKNSMFYFENTQLHKFEKYSIADGISGSSGWARVKREWTYSREPSLRTVLVDSRHLQFERGRPTWKEKIWTLTRPNGKSQS